MNIQEYKNEAKEARLKVLELIYKAQTSHIGSNFSAIDILTVLFNKIDLDKDRFVLSAGWKAASLYYFLWKKGRITEEQLNSYCQDDSEFIGLAEPFHPDIPIAGGSMGLGLPAAVGIAMAKKMKGDEGKVYVLMSDGELNCGTTWESILLIKQHNLNNLIVIVDMNGFQAMGKTEDILETPTYLVTSPKNIHVSGHNYEDLESAFDDPRWSFIYADTVKGKGVSFMENNNDWHYLHMEESDYLKAKEELERG